MAEGMGSQSRWKRCRLAVVVVVLAVVVVDVVVIVVAAVVVAVALAVAAVVVVVALVVALAPPVHVVVLWCQVQRAFTSSLPILVLVPLLLLLLLYSYRCSVLSPRRCPYPRPTRAAPCSRVVRSSMRRYYAWCAPTLLYPYPDPDPDPFPYH